MGIGYDCDYDDSVSHEGKKIKHEEGPIQQNLQLTKRGEAQEDKFRRVAQICHDPGAESLHRKETKDRDAEAEIARQRDKEREKGRKRRERISLAMKQRQKENRGSKTKSVASDKQKERKRGRCRGGHRIRAWKATDKEGDRSGLRIKYSATAE